MKRLWDRVTGHHRYWSTACVHGHHGRCRKACKFCPAPCRCKCHRYESREATDG